MQGKGSGSNSEVLETVTGELGNHHASHDTFGKKTSKSSK